MRTIIFLFAVCAVSASSCRGDEPHLSQMPSKVLNSRIRLDHVGDRDPTSLAYKVAQHADIAVNIEVFKSPETLPQADAALVTSWVDGEQHLGDVLQSLAVASAGALTWQVRGNGVVIRIKPPKDLSDPLAKQLSDSNIVQGTIVDALYWIEPQIPSVDVSFRDRMGVSQGRHQFEFNKGMTLREALIHIGEVTGCRWVAAIEHNHSPAEDSFRVSLIFIARGSI